MNILITGGTGFIGRVLVSEWLKVGHAVTVFTRNKQKARLKLGAEVGLIDQWSAVPKHARFDWVVNLAGEGIADRPWTQQRKAQLRASRITFTQQLVQCLERLESPPSHLISASAVGFYGDQAGEFCDESATKGVGFAADLCFDWEAAALSYESAERKVYLMRLGVVLDPSGGFLKRLLPMFKIGAGVVFGSGQQCFPWIHLQDVVSIVGFLIEKKPTLTVINAVAPEVISQKAFAHYLSNRLRRPLFLKCPAWILKTLLREQAGLFLDNSIVVPRQLTAHGFVYQYPRVSDAPL